MSEIITCKICGKEFNNKRGFRSHISKLHKLLKEDYDEIYLGIPKIDYSSLEEGIDYLVCPICKGHYSNLRTHVTRYHKLEWKEFSEKFNITRSTSDKEFNNRSESNKEKWTRLEYRELKSQQVSAQMKNRVISDETRKKLSIATTLQWQTNEEFARKVSEAARRTALIRVKTPESIARWNKMNEEYLTDPVKIEEKRNRTKKNNRGKMNDYTRKDGSVTRLRSVTVERSIATALDDLNVDWKYEYIIPKYFYEGKYHDYQSDFYIPKYNLVIEGKPKYEQCDKVVLLKRQSVLDLNYNFEFASNYSDTVQIIEKYK